MRQSIPPTYDSRETGPRYFISTSVRDRPISWEHRIEDPFVRHDVYLGFRDLLRGLLNGALKVTVQISADPEIIEDVLELDANYLGQNCTRRSEFQSAIFKNFEGEPD